MKTTLVYLFASASFVAFTWLAATSETPLARMAWGLAASLIVFLMGIGCGERSHANYSNQLFSANQQLEEQLRLLREKHASSSDLGRLPTTQGPASAKRFRDTGHEA